MSIPLINPLLSSSSLIVSTPAPVQRVRGVSPHTRGGADHRRPAEGVGVRQLPRLPHTRVGGVRRGGGDGRRGEAER